ncbi:MAG TPA: CPBP family intramembrane glutamic endopeptidase [Puia sp.]|nr:CPBP family intramembrane glutamic endopeptidase [Puia sp.]
MRAFLDYFLTYWRRSSLPAFLLTLVFLAVLVTINYTVGIERRIQGLKDWYWVYTGQAVFFALVVAVAWVVQVRWGGAVMSAGLLRLLVVAVLLFSAKMVHWDLSPWLPGTPGSLLNRYGVIVTQLPAKLLLFGLVLWGLWKAKWVEAVGLTTKGFRAAPYFGLLLLLVPLVALASTQPDFLRVYPKVRSIAFMSRYQGPLWLWRAGYEFSYGLDFLSIELFFRGLLVIGLARYAGEKAILPMAAFYCTIHFGKPLAECITSFAGGMALGVLACRTRSVLGGLMVHLGLAWLMEGMSFLFIFIHPPS